MRHVEYLTEKQITILLKCYFLRDSFSVCVDEKITEIEVEHIKEEALEVIREAYSYLVEHQFPFDGAAVLEYMAKHSAYSTTELSSIFNRYIAKGLDSKDSKYWQRIKCKRKIPTAYELLDYLYDKYEADIETEI